MKKILNAFKAFKLPALGLLTSAIVLAACSKNDNDFIQPPAAGLMLFNLAPDKPAVGFTLSGNQLGNGVINYTGFTGNYLSVYTGNRELRSVDASNNSTITFNNQLFEDSTYYSAFLLGYGGNYKHVITQDDYTNVLPAAGKAWVRYINAVADSSVVSNVSIGEATETANYGKVSAFTQVNAGTVTTSINGTGITATRDIAMAENKIYTVLFVGNPLASTPELGVQVKFIENGIATN